MADAILARQLTEQVTRLRQRQTAPLILELDLTDGIGEGPVTDPLSAIMSRRRARLPGVIQGPRRAITAACAPGLSGGAGPALGGYAARSFARPAASSADLVG